MRERSLVFYANFKQSNLPFFYRDRFLNGPGLPPNCKPSRIGVNPRIASRNSLTVVLRFDRLRRPPKGEC